MRYRGAGSSRSTSRTVPERARRSVDSDSACTRSPTSNVMEILPSIAALRAYGLTSAAATGDARLRTSSTLVALPDSPDRFAAGVLGGRAAPGKVATVHLGAGV